MKTWIKKGNIHLMDASSENLECLPKAVYIVKYNMNIGMYLEKISESFEFNYKIYGIEENFINRVLKSYDHSSNNMGVLLNGVKGTGKTITAELIAKATNLPIIIINEDFGEKLVEFISSITEEVVLFFDEYEKIFEKTNHMLTVMDGVMSNGSKKLILLTTNKVYVDDNLLQRPGRIRYIKYFNNISKSAIQEIVDDLLVNKEKYMSDLLSTLEKIEIVTIDIVKALINEVNLHNDLASNLIKDFNVELKSPDEYRVYIVEKGKSKFVYTFDSRYCNFNYEIGEELTMPSVGDLGQVVEIKNEDVIVQLYKTRPFSGISAFDKDLVEIDNKKGDSQPIRKGQMCKQKEPSEFIYLHLKIEPVKQYKYMSKLAF